MNFQTGIMTTLRQFTCDDLFRFNGINLDPLTEMYGLSFYLQVLNSTLKSSQNGASPTS